MPRGAATLSYAHAVRRQSATRRADEVRSHANRHRPQRAIKAAFADVFTLFRQRERRYSKNHRTLHREIQMG